MTAPLATRVVRDSRPRRISIAGMPHGHYVPWYPTTRRYGNGEVVWRCYDRRSGCEVEISTSKLRRARRMAP